MAVAAVTPAVGAIDRMARAGASAAVVLDGVARFAGIVTEQDVVRRFAGRRPAGRGDHEPRRYSPSAPTTSCTEAIGFMRRHRLRHMPVVDGEGAVVGMLELHEALAVAAGPMVEDIDRLTHEDSLAGLAEVKAAQVQLAERLLADGVPAPEIQALVADINNDIHRRVLRPAGGGARGRGQGPPPVPFACIVMGSGGRGESLLFPDQDNGFVLADYPDERHAEIDPWFVELAVAADDGARPAAASRSAGRGDGDQPGLAQDAGAVAAAGRALDARPGAGDAPRLRDLPRLPLRLRRVRPGRGAARAS